MPILALRLLSPAERSDEGWALACEWLIRDDSGSVRGQGITDYRGLGDVADPNQGWINDPSNVLLLVPNEHVLELSVNVPGRNTAQIRKALPFACEEYVAADIESMHIAHGPIRPNTPTQCEIINRSLLEGWLEALRGLGIEPGHMHSDAGLLPVAEDEATLLFDGSNVIVRTLEESATIDRGNLTMVIPSLGVEQVVCVLGQLTDLEQAQLTDVSVSAEDVQASSSIEYLANQYTGTGGINLLQGEYQPKQVSTQTDGRWRTVAMFAVGWLLLAWVAMGARAFWADSQSDSLEAEAQQRYQEIFPSERNVRNVRRALAAKLGDRGSSAGAKGFIELTGDLAQVMSAGVQLRSLEFAEARGELKAEVVVASFSDLERIQQQLAGRGLTAQLQNSVQEDQGVRAFFVLKDVNGGNQ